MRAAGIHYLKKQNAFTGVTEAELVHVAGKSLGLSDIAPFDPEAKIVEYRLRRKDGLVERTVRGFTDELSSESPAPGGGSVAALLGAQAAGLAAMVAALTHGKKGFEAVGARMNEIGEEAQRLKDAFLEDVDRDTDAFNAVMAAMKMPRKTHDEIAARTAALDDATREATNVPLRVLERSHRVAELARDVAQHGNPNSLSDAGVAALCADACAEGAHFNVLINVAGKTSEAWAAEARAKADAALARTKEVAGAVARTVREALRSG
jgi:glutamate formiminotransferase/formiminotetrahydrofolate cyclodeaminase